MAEPDPRIKPANRGSPGPGPAGMADDRRYCSLMKLA